MSSAFQSIPNKNRTRQKTALAQLSNFLLPSVLTKIDKKFVHISVSMSKICVNPLSSKITRTSFF